MAATWEIQVAASIESLIEDWKSSVVKDITSSDDIDKLTDYALHLSRILAYPCLDVSAILSTIDSMGHEVARMAKKDLTTPRRTTQLIDKITTVKVKIRMLNKLKGSFYEAQDIEKYTIANEMVLAIDRYNPDAIRDKGIMLLKKGESPEALKVLNSYLEINPEAEDAD